MTAIAPRPRRRFALDIRLVLGLVLVAASVVAVMALVSAADARVVIYAAAGALAPGDHVDAAELVERSVALDGAEDLYLAQGSIPVGGFVIAQAVAAGQLIPLSAAGSTDGVRATSLVLQLSGPVSTVVEPGSLVDVWGTARLEQGEIGTPVVLAAQATVVRVIEDQTLIAGGGSSSATVEVLVLRTRVARLLQAIANGDALAVVPAGIPLGSR